MGTAADKAEETADQTQQKLNETKREIGFGKLFQEFLSNLRSGKGKESFKSLTALIAVFFGRKLASLKADVEKKKKGKTTEVKKGDQETQETVAEEDREGDEEYPEEDDTEAIAEAEDDEPLPDDLTGIPYNSENLLKCKDFKQCQELMKANGFIYDKGSKNYINPKWLSPERILREPLVEENIGGKKIKLKKSVMDRLVKADEKMFAETGEHIKVGEHFRSNEHQFDLFKKLRPNGGRVALPGHSFHEIGQAVDLPLNWEKAQKYMWAAGFIGGKAPIGLARDANHFSVGEIGMTDKRVAALKAEGVTPEKKAA